MRAVLAASLSLPPETTPGCQVVPRTIEDGLVCIKQHMNVRIVSAHGQLPVVWFIGCGALEHPSGEHLCVVDDALAVQFAEKRSPGAMEAFDVAIPVPHVCFMCFGLRCP